MLYIGFYKGILISSCISIIPRIAQNPNIKSSSNDEQTDDNMGYCEIKVTSL